MYKLFGKNNVKVSCSCMSNMKSIINTHKKKIINPPKENITRTCNGIRKHQCPFNEKCLTNMSYTKQVSRQTKKIRKFNSSKLIFFERNVFERSTGVLLENHWRTTYLHHQPKGVFLSFLLIELNYLCIWEIIGALGWNLVVFYI